MPSQDANNYISAFRAFATHKPQELNRRGIRSISDLVDDENLNTEARWANQSVAFSSDVKKLMSHLSASTRNSELIKNNYVFSHTETNNVSLNNTMSEYIVNASSNSVRSFIANASSNAHSCRESIINRTKLINPVRYTLLGKKGSGKTAFLNYILSCELRSLHEERVIAIRIDLTRLYKNWSIVDKFHHHTIKILREKYFGRSKEHENLEGLLETTTFSEEDFLAYVHSNPSIVKKSFTGPDAVDEIGSLITNHLSIPQDAASQQYSEKPVDLSILFQSLTKYFSEEKGFAFLWIFDGLDAIVPDSDSEEKFASWIEEAKELQNHARKFPGCFVLTMRDDSYRDSNYRVPTGKHEIRLQIANVRPRKIFWKRIKNRELYGLTPSQQELLMKFRARLLDLIAAGLRLDSSHSSYDVFDFLTTLFCNDIRETLRFIEILSQRLLYSIAQEAGLNPSNWTKDKTHPEEHKLINEKVLDFVNNEGLWAEFRDKKRYLVFEILALGRKRRHYTPIRFFAGKESSPVVVTKHNKQFNKEAGFLPNIFGYPRELAREIYEDELEMFPLLKLSVLGFLKEQEELICTPTPENEIVKDLQEKGLDPLISQSILKELKFFDFIEVSSTVEDEKAYRITNSGKVLLERIIENPNYLLSIILTAPVRVRNLPGFRFFAEFQSDSRKAFVARLMCLALYIQNIRRFLNKTGESTKIGQFILEFSQSFLDNSEANLDKTVSDIFSAAFDHQNKQYRLSAAIEDCLGGWVTIQ